MLKLKNKLLFIIGLFNGFVQASALLQSSEQEKLSPLMVAIQNDRADRLRLLLDAGANVNHVHAYDGRTALIEASRSGYADVVRLLLAAGANVNHASVYDGKTALKEASLNGHADVVRLLLAAGVDVDQISGAGVDQVFDYSWTALMFASRNGHADIVRLLLGAGAGVDQVSNDGWTALMFASRNGHADIVRLLLGAGADVNICSFNGWTSLKLCIHYYRNIDIVKILIQEARINWHLPEHNIDTLITLANAQGHGEVAAFLQQKKDADARWHGLRMAWIGAVHLASNDHLHDPSVVSDSSSQRRRIGLSS